MRENAMALLKKGTVIPAVPLALDAQGRFDEGMQRRLIVYYLEAGVGGLAAAVHTTQFEIRDPGVDLLEPVLRVVSQECDAFEKRTGRVVVRIAGACGPAGQAAEEARLARSLGFDAVLLSPGGMGSLTEEELIARTEAVAKELPVVGFYLQPSVGGRVFSYGYWQRLCEIPGVVAIKAAPFDRYLTLDVARAVACSSRREEIALYTGNDDNLLCDLMTEYRFNVDGEERSVRFVGGLLGHWAVWTKSAVDYFAKVTEAVKTSLFPAELLTLAAQITDANSAFFDTAHNFKGCIVGIHEVLRRQGLFAVNRTLNPQEQLAPSQAAEIDRVYAMYPHLNDDAFVLAFLKNYGT